MNLVETIVVDTSFSATMVSAANVYSTSSFQKGSDMTATQTVKQQVPAGTYKVDPVHSSINFAVVYNGVTTFRSGFRAYEATLEGGEAPRLEGSVEVASIDIDEEAFRGHLLSPEFFDAERQPRLKF